MYCIQVKLSPKKHFPKYVRSESEECFRGRFIQNCLPTPALLVYLQVPCCVAPDPLADAIMVLKQLGNQ